MANIDLSHYKGREQAYIKHQLLAEYIRPWAYKVSSKWDRLVYVDGLAGPWLTKSERYEDSSFGVAIAELEAVATGLAYKGKSLDVACYLNENSTAQYAHLESFAKSKTRPGFKVVASQGRFADNAKSIVEQIEQDGGSSFKLVFLDPKGWSEIPMHSLLPLIQDRSSEVVVNLMTRFVRRFVQEPSREQSVVDLFGSQEAVDRIVETPREDREDVLVHEYCRSLKEVAGFKYASSAAVYSGAKNEILYFIIYGTNHHRGVEVFKHAEITAARLQDQLKHERAIESRGGQEDMMAGLFGEAVPKSNLAFMHREHYCAIAKKRVGDTLLSNLGKRVLYSKLFCEAMGLPLVTPDDLKLWLQVHWDGCVEVVFQASSGGGIRRIPDPDKEDYVVVTNPEVLTQLTSP